MWPEKRQQNMTERQRNMTKDIKENNRQEQGTERRFQIEWKGPVTKATNMKKPIIDLGGSASTEALIEHLKKHAFKL